MFPVAAGLRDGAAVGGSYSSHSIRAPEPGALISNSGICNRRCDTRLWRRIDRAANCERYAVDLSRLGDAASGSFFPPGGRKNVFST